MTAVGDERETTTVAIELVIVPAGKPSVANELPSPLFRLLMERAVAI